MGGKWVHRLVEKDEDSMTGVCESCGSVALVRKGKGVRCQRGRDSQKGVRVTIGYRNPDEKLNAWSMQDGKCAICECSISLNEGQLDHCHVTNELRGVLCMRCNIGLGYFGDDADILVRAYAYLSMHDGETWEDSLHRAGYYIGRFITRHDAKDST